MSTDPTDVARIAAGLPASQQEWEAGAKRRAKALGYITLWIRRPRVSVLAVVVAGFVVGHGSLDPATRPAAGTLRLELRRRRARGRAPGARVAVGLASGVVLLFVVLLIRPAYVFR